jgi:hypothetical protein
MKTEIPWKHAICCMLIFGVLSVTTEQFTVVNPLIRGFMLIATVAGYILFGKVWKRISRT